MIPDIFDEMWDVGVHSKLVHAGTPCDTYPCWNNGFCVPNNNTTIGYYCLCNDFFNGTHCQNRIVESSIENCEQLGKNVECVWKTLLETLNKTTSSVQRCLTNVCLNGGVCITSGGNHTHCLCPIEFRGKNCSEQTYVGFDLNSLKIFCMLISVFIIIKIILFFCYSSNFGCCFMGTNKNYKYSRWYLPEDFNLYSHDHNEEDDSFEIIDSRTGIMTFDDELRYVRLKNLGIIPPVEDERKTLRYDSKVINSNRTIGSVMKELDDRIQRKEYYEMKLKSSITTDTFLDIESSCDEEDGLKIETRKSSV
uniref:EGF-like domain-containing protein n=1 Tax=Parastrongyloides trichosuri TaxID=131310 RepID=A0A0N4ZBW5_PARTI